jgi:hypothetical protein
MPHRSLSTPLQVTLASVGNPDHAQPADRSLPGVPSETVEILDLAAASRTCRAYIERHQLGAGNWAGGIVTRAGVPIARVSYNGRVWAPGNWQPGDQPLYDPQ